MAIQMYKTLKNANTTTYSDQHVVLIDEIL